MSEYLSWANLDLAILSKEDVPGLENLAIISPSTGSNQSLQLAAQWLEVCNDSHSTCQCEISSEGAEILPTRLIDIGTEDSVITPRLYAKDGNEGMFRDRDPLKIQQDWCNLMGPETSQIYCVINRAFWSNEVNFSALPSRAWVCQERFLSKRNLHFAHQQLIWECRQKGASETFPKGFPKDCFQSDLKSELLKASHSNNSDHSSNFRQPRAVWWRLVQSYSNGDLTYQTDKLVAIGGLAAAVHQSIGGKYLAGLWENHLPYGLVWRRIGKPEVSAFVLSTASTGPQTFIAPSWSWASLNSEVSMFPTNSENRDDLCRISESHVDLASGDPYGQVRGGYIKVTGKLARAEYNDTCIFVQTSNEVAPVLLEFNNFLWDYTDMTALNQVDFIYLMPVHETFSNDGPRRQVDGLVIYQTGRSDGEFRRSGAFTLLDAFSCRELESGCKAFRNFFEGNKTSGIEQDGDGNFTITII
ncbi:hypothetical protein SBOR_2654 [Sclerotinia borealis F-4128]|uniref:Heterokaryon incompatibility domain-containing protein n=1 Tax=Sclerotinia borealis (strain F-4128) TaxID=1432307 RepID=W9CJL9_SCLBF|nr:hypothetical protein SBOR_2654 [Sclerotinia borealis F-4128]